MKHPEGPDLGEFGYYNEDDEFVSFREEYETFAMCENPIEGRKKESDLITLFFINEKLIKPFIHNSSIICRGITNFKFSSGQIFL